MQLQKILTASYNYCLWVCFCGTNKFLKTSLGLKPCKVIKKYHDISLNHHEANIEPSSPHWSWNTHDSIHTVLSRKIDKYINTWAVQYVGKSHLWVGVDDRSVRDSWFSDIMTFGDNCAMRIGSWQPSSTWKPFPWTPGFSPRELTKYLL